MKNREVVLTLTPEEAGYLIAILHIEGFQERRDIPKSLWAPRNEISKTMSRILKRLRKALEAL